MGSGRQAELKRSWISRMSQLIRRVDGINEGVKALWWWQERVCVHGRRGNWAWDSEVVCASVTRK